MAQHPTGGLVRGYDRPIHGSCAIYFPGGIVVVFVLILVAGKRKDFYPG